MLTRRSIACAALLLGCFLGFATHDSAAQSRNESRRHPDFSPAGQDTTPFFPAWLHPWLEIGGDWLVSPSFMKPLYESGQAFGIGVYTRPRKRLELRLAFDYQSLQAQHDDQVVSFLGTDPGGNAVLDTTDYQSTSVAWSGTIRPEIGVMLAGDVWVTGGVGAGYMNGGFEDYVAYLASGAVVLPPDAMRNGWGWLWTAAARWDIEPDPSIPLGFEARTTSMRRGSDFVHMASVRITYRVPTALRGPGRHRN